MKASIGIALLLLARTLMGQQVPDTAHVATVAASVSVGTAGFAPVPAFSFDSPLATGNLSLAKGRIRYEPDISVGLNGKPWMSNHWFRYRAVRGKRLEATAGLNPSFFFLHTRSDSGQSTIAALRDLTFEGTVRWTVSSHTQVVVTWMQINAFDPGGLSGSFVDVTCVVAIQPADGVKATLKPSVFYFDFDGNTDGLYGAATFTARLASIPIGLYLQLVSPVWTSFEGGHFKWNTGLTFNFLSTGN